VFERSTKARKIMIKVTRLNGSQFFINPELILTVEETPNTVITLLDQKKLVVKESAADVIEKFLEYQKSIRQQGLQTPPPPAAE
jgi:flagellar protein FlbD